MKKIITLCDFCNKEIENPIQTQLIMKNVDGNTFYKKNLDLCEKCIKMYWKIQSKYDLEFYSELYNEILKNCNESPLVISPEKMKGIIENEK